MTETDRPGGPLGRVAVIVPTYNERANLEQIASRLRTAVPDADLLIVDDNSPDGTGEAADKLAAGDARIHVLHRPAKGERRYRVAGFVIGDSFVVLWLRVHELSLRERSVF